jgi:hypothetical protein
MSRRRKLEATNLLNEAKKIRQARHVERTNYHDERSNENITSKRANKIICPFDTLSGNKKQ